MSKTQIDRLGDRLKIKGADGIDEEDLRNLDGYRQRFAEPYRYVVDVLRNRFGSEPTGRPAKSTTSIIDKLRRESIRLSQIQDIAGARLVLTDVNAQNAALEEIRAAIDHVLIVDRRERPSHGYRAVHAVATVDGLAVEIQVRSVSQHNWAELSEKLSDIIDPALKYGGGDARLSRALQMWSAFSADIEMIDTEFFRIKVFAREHPDEFAEVKSRLATSAQRLDSVKARQAALYREFDAAIRIASEER